MFKTISQLIKVVSSKDLDELVSNLSKTGNKKFNMTDLINEMLLYDVAATWFDSFADSYEKGVLNDFFTNDEGQLYSSMTLTQRNNVTVNGNTCEIKIKSEIEMTSGLWINIHNALKNNENISIDITEIVIEEILHRESGAVIVKNIPLVSKRKVKGTVMSVAVHQERLASLFNQFKNDDRTSVVVNTLQNFGVGDEVGESIHASVGLCYMLFIVPRHISFDAKRFQMVYTKAVVNDYQNYKNINPELLKNQSIREYIKTTTNPDDFNKVCNYHLLTGTVL